MIVEHCRRTSNGDVTRFSTTRTTPSFDLTPMAVVPSCAGIHTAQCYVLFNASLQSSGDRVKYA